MNKKSKAYDPLDQGRDEWLHRRDWADNCDEEEDEVFSDYDDEGMNEEEEDDANEDGYYDEEDSQSDHRRRGPRKQEYMGRDGDKGYFRNETSDEESDMEAGYDDIMEEELISGMIGRKEDEAELERLRTKKRQRKQR